MSFYDGLAVEVVFLRGTQSSSSVWSAVSAHFQSVHGSGVRIGFGSESHELGELESVIESGSRDHFHLEICERVVLSFNAIGSSNVSVVSIPSDIPSVETAEAWINAFLEADGFISARVYDARYEYWQNAQDFLEYEVAGRSVSGLPTTSNGLPDPLERTIIDVSANPGRRIIRSDLIEAVSSPMWVSEALLNLANRKAAELSFDGCSVSRVTPSVWRVDAQHGVFDGADGRQGETQERLRVLLFPNDRDTLT
ncbi:MAG: hypothetical protein AAFR09_08220 [Pseudomonadota bacterium]